MGHRWNRLERRKRVSQLLLRMQLLLLIPINAKLLLLRVVHALHLGLHKEGRLGWLRPDLRLLRGGLLAEHRGDLTGTKVRAGAMLRAVTSVREGVVGPVGYGGVEGLEEVVGEAEAGLLLVFSGRKQVQVD